MCSLAGYFKNNELSDIDLVFRQTPEHNSDDTEDGAEPAPKRTRRSSSSDGAETQVSLQLALLPGHKLILFTSEYFKAQAQHWQPEVAATSSSSRLCAQRPAVYLTIDSAEQLPAAEAVIAAMYGVPEPVSSLDQQQLVHAITIADMVHAESAVQQAVQALAAAAGSEQGLSAATVRVLAGLHARPACLVKLLPAIVFSSACCKLYPADLAAIKAADTHGSVQRLLLADLGDLEAVWADEEMQQLLFALPLPAMQLLLSSDQLRVASEDTVLYTAQQYAEKFAGAHRVRIASLRKRLQATATLALAALVRVPQLSELALWNVVRAAEISDDGVLNGYAEQLKRMQRLRRIASATELAEAVEGLQEVPASWKLGPRTIRPLADGVRLEWRLPLEQLTQACRDSYGKCKHVLIESPNCSPPLSGLAWGLSVICRQQDGGTVVGLHLLTKNLPSGMYYKYGCTITWGGERTHLCTPCVGAGTMQGYTKYFPKLAPMAGDGWDEAAWAAAGLPTSGEMLLQLHVHSVQ